MRLVVAIIRPFKLDSVREALVKAGVGGMTVTEVKGFGRQKGHAESRRGADYEVQYVLKLMLLVAVKDDAAASVVETIRAAAHTESTGDGKIFVIDLADVMRIRTGETGAEAL
jgi:nitrogen regulatory protein P-II 2